MKKLYRSCTALLMAFCLILGLCSAGIQASAVEVPSDLPVDEQSLVEWAQEVLTRALAIDLHDDDSAAQIKDLVEDIIAGTEAQIAELEAYIDAKEAEMDAAVADADAQLADAKQKIADAKQKVADAKQKIADAKIELAEKKGEFEEKVAELEEKKAELAEKKAELEQAKADLAGAPDDPELQAKLADAEAKLADAEAKLADAEAKKADAQQKILDAEEKIADAEAQIADAEAQIADAEKQIADAEAQKDELVAQANTALTTLNKLLAAAQKALDEAKPYVDVTFDNAQPALDKLVALNDALNKLIHEGCNAAARELQTAIYEVLDGAVYVAEKITGKSADKLTAKAAKAKAELDEMYIEATQTTMGCVDLTKYVALGDANAYGPAADKLADEIQKYLGKQPEFYANLTAPNQTAAQLLANLDSYKADLADATLITLSFNTNAFSKFAFDQATKYVMGKTATCDWATYGGEALISYMEEAKAELFAKLEAKGYENVNAMVVLAESYAYAYAQHILSYYPLVKQIQAINPDAQIVLVGMHNPMEGITTDVYGANVPMGDFMRYLTDIANIYSLGYAMLSEGKIYVDAFEVEVSSSTGSLLDYVPTDAGYTTIAQNIWNSLGIQNHDYESVVTGPTCTENGYTTHTCSCCGHSYTDSVVDALGHDWVLDHVDEDGEWYKCSRCDEMMFVGITGDMIGVVVAALVVTGMGITVLKKKEF